MVGFVHGYLEYRKRHLRLFPQREIPRTAAYLKMLTDAGIPPEYSGSMECLNWDEFLSIILRCVVSHAAPYSPVFYSEADQLFFYLHHTGSIGLYYEKETTLISEILETAAEQYEIVSR